MTAHESLRDPRPPRPAGARSAGVDASAGGAVLYVEDDAAYASLVAAQLAEQPGLDVDVVVRDRLAPALELLA
ncbi:MAG: hypothetical protein ACQETV_09590, partial [Actinomycetota bacterium]